MDRLLFAVGRARVVRWVLVACAITVVLVPIVVMPGDAPAAVGLPLLVEFVALAVFFVSAARMTPGARRVWWALWLSLLFTVAGDSVYDYQQYHLGTNPFPGWADPLYLASYVPEFVAVLLLIRSRHPRRDREQWLDSAIIAIPIGAAVSVFVLIPMVAGQGWGLATVAGAAYPVLDTVLLVGLIRLLVGGGRPNLALSLVASSVALTLVADLTFNALASEGQIQDTPGWMQALFSLGVILMTAGVLARNAGQVQLPAPDSDKVMSAPRAVALGLGTLTLPILLLTGVQSDIDTGVRVFAFALLVVNLLVLWRALILLRVVQRQRRDLSHAARTDALTGLPNRRSWDFELDRAAAWSQTTHTDLTIAMIDVDRFKEYNDQFGHQAGDEVLVDCALAWRSALPHEAYLARYGGDEFALLLPGLDTDEAEPVLDLLRLSTPQSVSASIGYAHHHPDTAIRQTLTEADAALYAAKAAGRDTVTGPNMTAVASSA